MQAKGVTFHSPAAGDIGGAKQAEPSPPPAKSQTPYSAKYSDMTSTSMNVSLDITKVGGVRGAPLSFPFAAAASAFRSMSIEDKAVAIRAVGKGLGDLKGGWHFVPAGVAERSSFVYKGEWKTPDGVDLCRR